MKIKFAIALSCVSTSALAQGLSPFGGWGGPPENAQVYSAPMPSFDLPWNEPVFETPPPAFENRPQKNQNYGNIKVDIEPVAPEIVYYPNNEQEGTVIIETNRKLLFYTINDVKAFRYPISVGREGFQWSGIEHVSRIQEWPDWTPPKEMLQRRPELPSHMNGGLKNPLGAVAIYLGNSLYRIHGTNDPKSIGRAESSGCIRMMNEHAVHLASIVDIGTTVKVFK